MDTKIIYKILDSIFIYIFYGVGVLALVKTYIFLNSLRFYSILKIFFNKNKIIKNQDLLELKSFLVYRNIYSKNSKENLSKIQYYCLVTENKIVLNIAISAIRFFYKKRFIDSLKNIKNLDNENFIRYLISKINDINIKRKKILEDKSIHLFKSRKDFEGFLFIYDSYISVYEIVLYDLVNRYRSHKNLYDILFFILRDLLSYINIFNRVIPFIFNKLNGEIYEKLKE